MKKTKGLFLDALAMCEFHLGNIDKALQYSLEAITLAQEVGDPQLLKITHADLGNIHMHLGNYYRALELIHISLEIDETSHDPWRKRNRSLSNLSHLYYLVGQHERALEYIQEALESSEKEKDTVGRARCLNAKGVILCILKEYDEAENCLMESLSLAKEKLNDKTLQNLILTNLSFIYYSLSEFQKAKGYLKEALALNKQMSDKSNEANILLNMAMIEIETENIEKATEYAEKALNVNEQTHNLSGQADALYLLGSIEDYRYDNSEKAHGYYRESIAISENLRKNVMLDDFKISFAENYIHAYQQMVSLCIREGKAEEAFDYIEKSKSRALVDMLSNIIGDLSSKNVSEEKLEEINIVHGKLEILRKQLNSAYSCLDDERSSPDNNRQLNRVSNLEEELTRLESSYKKTFEELKKKDPEWVSLTSSDSVNLKSIQDLLGEKTLLLDFYQTNEELIILSIRKNKEPSIYRIVINVDDDSEMLFNLFNALSGCKGGIDIKSHDYIKYIKQPLSYFYDLLISPILKDIKEIDHIIVIPHFFWHYLPFHALYDSVNKEYLIDRFSISYAPSATALELCLDKKNTEYNNALILANPSNDLPFANEEADKVRARFKQNVHLFNEQEASFDKLADYNASDVIHLACHGYFRGDDPVFSHLVFASTNPEESCYYLPDLFNLRLNTSLVTLSACETGLSQYTSGDELIGISRAFFYAGTPSLLASHWTVNDKSTAFLMDKFYEGLVNKGKSKAEALKLAIQDLKSIPEYKHPFFWAPFFLSGDWR